MRHAHQQASTSILLHCRSCPRTAMRWAVLCSATLGMSPSVQGFFPGTLPLCASPPRGVAARGEESCLAAEKAPWSSCGVFVSSLAALSVLLPAVAVAELDGIPGTAGCKTESNPSVTTVTCLPRGLDRNGRLFSCRSSENCVGSSSIRTPSKFVPPWSYGTQTTDANQAFGQLVEAVKRAPGVSLAEIDTKGLYLRAEFPSKVPPDGKDDAEFQLRPADAIVSVRSASRQSLFVYPLQQPVTDQSTNQKRLESIRKDLGWESLSYGGDGQ